MKIRKKTIALCVIFSIGSGLFVQGQVGINTTEPKSTLDIAGNADQSDITDGIIAPRITGTQLKNKDDRYTADQDGAIVYVTQGLAVSDTTERTRTVLRKGYYNFDASRGTVGEWVRMFDNAPTVLSGANASNAHTGAAVIVSAANNNTGNASLLTRTFTVTERSLVTFSISVPVNQILNANGSNLTDGTSKNYGFNLVLTGGGLNNYLFTRQGAAFSNGGNSYTTGIFQLNSTRSIVLEPGNYTADLKVYVYARDATGIRASFGGTGVGVDTVIDIIGVAIL
ncbi:MAG: hypothetical protein LBF27_33075 [Sphingobacterium sp.]|jgi:hypothetical protein|nr:hypothetical protein [Sphingobacterium sp.]